VDSASFFAVNITSFSPLRQGAMNAHVHFDNQDIIAGGDTLLIRKLSNQVLSEVHHLLRLLSREGNFHNFHTVKLSILQATACLIENVRFLRQQEARALLSLICLECACVRVRVCALAQAPPWRG
jgi:hypothetical protein